jgi:hypothetical protein
MSDDDAFGDSDDEFVDDPFFEEVYLDGWLKRKQAQGGKTKKGAKAAAAPLAKKWKKRWFRPFNQFLIYSAVKDGDEAVADRIDLREVSKIRMGDKENDFNIEFPNDEPIVLRAESKGEAKRWVNTLNERIQLFEDKVDFLAAKDDEMDDYIRKVGGKKKKKGGGGGKKKKGGGGGKGGSDDDNLLGVDSGDDDTAADEIHSEPEVGQRWKATKTGLHIRSEPGGFEVNKDGLREVRDRCCA